MCALIKKLIEEISFQDIIGLFTLIFGIIGGGFALYQWRKSNVYKRGESVKELIEKVREDEDIANIMDIIDWDEGFGYNGKFYIKKHNDKVALRFMNDDELFKRMDKTLSHFSYICYLKHHHTLTDDDMKIFEYEIRRLIDNKNVANYLYSLFHWSLSLNVEMSYKYLIDYCTEKEYIRDDFKNTNSKCYTQYLKLPDNYCKSKKYLYIKKYI